MFCPIRVRLLVDKAKTFTRNQNRESKNFEVMAAYMNVNLHVNQREHRQKVYRNAIDHTLDENLFDGDICNKYRFTRGM